MDRHLVDIYWLFEALSYKAFGTKPTDGATIICLKNAQAKDQVYISE